MCGLLVSVVQVSYFQQYTILELISFSSSDSPSPMLQGMYPTPFGNHYFGDFLLPLRLAELPAPYGTTGMYVSAYPLFAGIVLWPLSLLSYWVALPVFLFATLMILVLPLARLLVDREVSEKILLLGPLLLTGPMIAEFDRANLQGLLVGFSLIGLVAFLRKHYKIAGVWFAVAAAMKVTPILLLLLLVKVRAWRALLVSMIVGLGITIFSSFFYQGGPLQNFFEWKTRAATFQDPAIDVLPSLNHSFKGLFAFVATRGPSFLQSSALWAVDSYNAIFLCFFLLMVVFVTRKGTSMFSSVVYICVILSNGPPISYGYTSLFYLLPVAVIFYDKKGEGVLSVMPVLLLALYLAPKGVYICEENIFLYTIANPAIAGLLLITVNLKDVKKFLIGFRLGVGHPEHVLRS
jgi:hypothetical protein